MALSRLQGYYGGWPWSSRRFYRHGQRRRGSWAGLTSQVKVVMKREPTLLHSVVVPMVKLLTGAGLLLIIVFFATIPGASDLPRSTYNYARWWDVTVTWNGVGFKLPPPWFRLGNKAQVPGTVTFFRDQFPWAKRSFSSITFDKVVGSARQKSGFVSWF